METKAVLKPDEFKPVTLEVTFTSVEDAASFYALFNHSAIVEHVVAANDSDRLRNEMLRLVPGVYSVSSKYHDILNNMFEGYRNRV